MREELKKELKKEIKKQGKNVIHDGELDNSGTHYHEVGQISGDQWCVYMNSEWYLVQDYSEVIKVRGRTYLEEDFYERAEFKRIFNIDKADLDIMRDFLDGHSKEVVDFFNSTVRNLPLPSWRGNDTLLAIAADD